ncbi:MAG: diaminopimelate epimerase [Hyphomicrobiales bacterium]
MASTRMEALPFIKMSGSGNDFILIDNRSRLLDESNLAGFVAAVCRRRLSVGGDGVILIEESETADFRWRFFNADGSSAEMCGNGARCAARFARLIGICGTQVRFETEAGLVEAQVEGVRVKVKMTDPRDLEVDIPIHLTSGALLGSRVNTGVPHVVVLAARIEDIDVAGLGREIRFHQQFAPAGTNASFICPELPGAIAIRTYERGVEAETLACGTGAVAGALVAACKLGLDSPVRVRTAGGEVLTVYFEGREGPFHNVYQEGDARLIYKGVLHPEAWQ